MSESYRKFLESEIEKADKMFRDAMKSGDYDKACIYGKRASDLEMIYRYHATH